MAPIHTSHPTVFILHNWYMEKSAATSNNVVCPSI